MILSALLLSVATTAEAQHITIAKQGHFSVGGQTIQHSGAYDNRKFIGWAEQEETGQSYRADHAFVDFQIPVDAHRLPLVHVNVEVERDVPGHKFTLAQPDWFFRFLHVLIGCFLLLLLFVSFQVTK